MHIQRLVKTFAEVSDKLTHFNKENKVKEGQILFRFYQDLFFRHLHQISPYVFKMFLKHFQDTSLEEESVETGVVTLPFPQGNRLGI